MIARVDFGYKGQETMRVAAQANPENLRVLRDCLVEAPTDENIQHDYMWPREGLIDLDTDGPRLAALGVEFTVKSFKGTIPLQSILPDGKSYTVHVHIPNVGLLAVDEVTVEEDCCTDNLQRRLDEGWRILCVCPQMQRRPDYVLGRTKER